MYRQTQATPCPSHGQLSTSQNPYESSAYLDGDHTSVIDFTVELGTSLRLQEPRRKQVTGKPRRRGAVVGFAIHEDEDIQRGLVEKQNARLRAPKGQPQGSMLAQPAQRFRPQTSFAHEATGCEQSPGTKQPFHTSEVHNPGLERAGLCADQSRRPGVSVALGRDIPRPSRRGTIYIPSEETTMPSMHMGIFSPIKSLMVYHKDTGLEKSIEFTGIAAQMAQKRGPVKTVAAALAKRSPLQQSKRNIQETASTADIPGKNSGKENIPPGVYECLNKCNMKQIQPPDLLVPEPGEREPSGTGQVSRAPLSPKACLAQPCLEEPKAVSRSKRLACRPISATQIAFKECGATSLCVSPRPAQNLLPVAERSTESATSRPLANSTAGKQMRASSRFAAPDVDQPAIRQRYPTLSEHISDPTLYEDNWLAHQETAITQLVNNLFACSKGSHRALDPSLLRFKLLELYQDRSMSLLYKRVQASVLYGALSVPKDVLAAPARLRDDLGMRQAFVDLWLKTYTLSYLKSALEVVVGRQCLSSPSSSASEQLVGSKADKSSRRAVQKYIEAFLIRNEDSVAEPGKKNNAATCYQKTLIRSLMVIKLLDKARTVPNSLLPDRMFLISSEHKSSIAVVQALARMLQSGVGDITRALTQLDYSLSHIQYPLEELRYEIDNLAVDLRDGVRLTRLVELLLYPSLSHLPSRGSDEAATATITMPAGDVLSLALEKRDWPLSQHLRFPCLGRAPKIFNVQIALSALSGDKGMGQALGDVRAEDIVDGFREKSVALLWGLTRKWGLGVLIDWTDTRHDIKRLQIKHDIAIDELGKDAFHDNLGSYENDLRKWASIIARGRGLQLNNLTTSFSDGAIFEAILDEYEPYLHHEHADNNKRRPLHQRLVALGCSGQFAQLFAPLVQHAGGHIFDGDFTMAALTFLCSRLLSASKVARAAMVIQRAWRRSEERLCCHKRSVARRLAAECQAVTKARDRLFWAQKTILRYWRRYRGRRSCSRTAVDDVDSSVTDIWLNV